MKGGDPGGTFVREAVQTSCDQCLCPLGTVFYQQEQLWGVHAHSSDLEGERGVAGWGRGWVIGDDEGAQEESLGRPRCQRQGGWGGGVGTLGQELGTERDLKSH